MKHDWDREVFDPHVNQFRARVHLARNFLLVAAGYDVCANAVKHNSSILTADKYADANPEKYIVWRTAKRLGANRA